MPIEHPRVTLCAYDRPGAVGGPLSWAAEFARYLDNSEVGIRVLILCPAGLEGSRLGSELTARGIAVDVLDTSTSTTMDEQTEWILARWSESPTEIFLANLVLPALYACEWISEAGARTIAIVWSDPDHDQFYARVLRTFFDPRFPSPPHAVVCVSEFVTNRVKQSIPSRTRIISIPCGTRLSDHRASRPSANLRLLYAGRLVQEQKRIHDVIDAFARVAGDGITASICGDGPERARVIDRIARIPGLEYLGPIAPADMHRIMSEHHAIVLLSDYEGLPMSALEGMSCGLVPILLHERSGSQELIRNEINGFLIHNREQSFHAATERLRDPDLWSTVSTAARKTIEDRYSYDIVFPKWLNLFSTIAPYQVLNPTNVPKRVRLRSRSIAGSFPGYPPFRPARIDSLREGLAVRWAKFKQTIRPRSRFREFIARP